MSSDPVQTLLGETLDGKYRIEQEIGAGGMGVVYRAEHVGTGRPLAVKTILSRLVRSEDALERFRREARALGMLRHPNIVDVTDFGVASVDDHEVAYLVMEYLEGRTLRALLEDVGKLHWQVVVDLVEQIALALEAAHDVGIVHRDLKPDNIWLVPDARGGFVVRVLDFGIAKLREPGIEGADFGTAQGAPASSSRSAVDHGSDGLDGREDDVAPDAVTVERSVPAFEAAETAIRESPGHSTRPGPGLTVEGATLGTPAYMSPEQCLGGNVGPASDLYSLGVVTWQALIGRPMFDGSFLELVHKHSHEVPPRVDEENPNLPRTLGTALAKALEKDPARRYPSARAMAGSLRVATEGPGTILRRATILYLDHWESFVEISSAAAKPAILLVVPMALVAWLLGSNPLTIFFVAFVGGVLWGLATVATHAVFGVVVDHLRARPLEELDVRDIWARLNRRLGLDEKRGVVRWLPPLLSFYTRCELFGPVGQGDLAFQIAFHEGLAPGEVSERCEILSSSTKKAYDRVRLVILTSLLLIPILEGFLVFSIGFLAGLHPADSLIFSVGVAMLSLPVIAALVNPVLSSALALLYFRARQANGEDIALSAVTTSRV